MTVLSLVALSVASQPPPPVGRPMGLRVDPATLAAWTDRLMAGYTSPSWRTVAETRLWDWTQIVGGSLAQTVLTLFTTFLIGLWIWSTGVLQAPSQHRQVIGRVAVVGIVLGLAMNLLAANDAMVLDALRDHWATARLVLPPLFIVSTFGPIVLSLGIGAALVWCWENQAWQQPLRPLTAVGRTGFTNYIMQSVICTFLFYGWGLGWYGRVGPARGMAIGLAIYASQLALSNWWLRRFRMGPLEWIWRAITYWRTSPFRRA